MRVTALCLTGALLAVLLHRSGGELALLLSLAVCGVAAMVLMEPLEELRLLGGRRGVGRAAGGAVHAAH